MREKRKPAHWRFAKLNNLPNKFSSSIAAPAFFPQSVTTIFQLPARNLSVNQLKTSPMMLENSFRIAFLCHAVIKTAFVQPAHFYLLRFPSIYASLCLSPLFPTFYFFLHKHLKTNLLLSHTTFEMPKLMFIALHTLRLIFTLLLLPLAVWFAAYCALN